MRATPLELGKSPYIHDFSSLITRDYLTLQGKLGGYIRNTMEQLADSRARHVERHNYGPFQGSYFFKGDVAQEGPSDEPDTYSATLVLWNENKSITEIAHARDLQEETILSHIERLSRQGKIPKADLQRLLSPSLARSIPEILAVFMTLTDDKLSPIFQKFAGRYSYSDLRIARMFLK